MSTTNLPTGENTMTYNELIAASGIAAVRDALKIAENAAWMANVAAEDAADVAATAAEAVQEALAALDALEKRLLVEPTAAPVEAAK